MIENGIMQSISHYVWPRGIKRHLNVASVNIECNFCMFNSKRSNLYQIILCLKEYQIIVLFCNRLLNRIQTKKKKSPELKVSKPV